MSTDLSLENRIRTVTSPFYEQGGFVGDVLFDGGLENAGGEISHRQVQQKIHSLSVIRLQNVQFNCF